MKTLTAYGMERYEYRDIYEEKQFSAIPVIDGIAGEDATPYESASVEVAVAQPEEKSLPWLLSEDDVVEVKVELAPQLSAPVHTGEEAGKVSYYLNQELIQEYQILTTEEIERTNYLWVLRYVLGLFLPV